MAAIVRPGEPPPSDAPGARFGLGVDVVRESSRQEGDNLQRRVVGGQPVRAAVPIEDLALVRRPLNPELRDPAVADLPSGSSACSRKTRASKRCPLSVPLTHVPAPEARSSARVMFVSRLRVFCVPRSSAV